MAKCFCHSLIVGGTGMLRGASLELAKQSTSMTSVARTNRSLEALDDVVAETTRHFPLPLDWRNKSGFLSAIGAHLARHGQPDLVVAWIHDDALNLALARSLKDSRCAYYHVISTASGDPLRIAEECASQWQATPGFSYRQLVLGHVSERGMRRWLTHDEISRGVLDAIRAEAFRHIVGAVDSPSVR